MTKEDYLEIIKKIDNLASKYIVEEPKWESPEMKSMQDEVSNLNLKDIQLKLCPKTEGQETEFYVILDSEYEFPDVYEYPKEASIEVEETLYQLYTDYGCNNDFYCSMGIDLQSLVALVMNCKELPIISVKRNAHLNNVRYWNSTPYMDGLLSMVTYEKSEEQDHGPTL